MILVYYKHYLLIQIHKIAMDVYQRDQLIAHSDQILVNYRTNLPSGESLSSEWQAVWEKFGIDICSYILPDTVRLETPTTTKHSFSIAESTQKLRKLIIQNCQTDIFPEIRKQIVKIFYTIANSFVSNNLTQKDCLLNFMFGYTKIFNKVNVMVSCLSIVLNKFITRRGLDKEFYSTVNKQLNNHSLYENFVNDCLKEIEQLRDSCLNLNKNLLNELPDHPTIKKLKLLNLLTIFPYLEYLERSKKYYSELLPRIPKNISMFGILHAFIQTEKLLASVIPVDEQKLQKVQYLQTWRANQPECLIRVLCKEILIQLHVDMIEYVDYLVSIEEEETSSHSRTDYLEPEQKRQVLRYLWEITKVLSKNVSRLHTGISKEHTVKPENNLVNRLVAIIGDTKKYITSDQDEEGGSSLLFKIIQFKDNIQAIVEDCFDADSKLMNTIINNMEATLAEQQDLYNQKLCNIILNRNYICPINDPTPENLAFTPRKVNRRTLSAQSERMINEGDQELQHSKQLSNHYSYELFKLTPSKQLFIRRFQQQFSQKILSQWSFELDLTQQQLFIRAMQKQCGYLLCKNIQKMLADVWRCGETVVVRNGLISCRILSQDWPEFTCKSYVLADQLLQIRGSFEEIYHNQPENDKKKLTWLQDYGRVVINIAGIGSAFSELQASIVLALSKSFRPMKAQQLKEIFEFEGSQFQMQQILEELSENDVLTHNPHGNSYEINYENIRAYQFVHKEKGMLAKQKKPLTRDRGIIVEAHIAKILKRKKAVQKTDLSKLLEDQIKGGAATLTEIHQAIEKLVDRGILSIEKSRGIIRYLE